MRTILVTGGAGFIGSNFVRHIMTKYRDYKVVNLDALTYAGKVSNLKGVYGILGHSFVRGDIRNRDTVREIFESNEIDWIVNFAAESHVDRSIDEPEVFLTTNIIGTQVLLDQAKQSWKLNRTDKHCRKYRPGVKFLQVSTDEVYGTLGPEGLFVETMPLLPNSPYSASKGGADLLVRAYAETYGLPTNITRCSNNYGPHQHHEKLIPLLIRNCMRGRRLPIYGDGLQVRDWLHVSDHCEAIDLVLHNGHNGEIYNIGGNNEKKNLEIARLIVGMLGQTEDLIDYVRDRPGHDRRYAIDNTKISTKLGWRPRLSFEEGLIQTLDWYCQNEDLMD